MKIKIKNFMNCSLMRFGWFIFICSTSFSQERGKFLPVNLEQVLQLGGANSLTIQEYVTRYELTLAEYTESKEWVLPSFYGGFQTHNLNGTAMNADGLFFRDVTQNNFWGGLGLSVSWDFGQQIYQAQSSQKRTIESQFLSTAVRNQTLLKMVSAYFDLQTEQLKYLALLNLVNQSATLVEQIDIQVEAGLRFKSELFLAKSNHNHLKISLLKTGQFWYQKSAELINLLNLRQDVILISTDSLMLPISLVDNLDLMVGEKIEAYKSRPEYLSLQSGLESLHISRKTIHTGLFIPTLTVNTHASYFGDLSISSIT